MVYLTVNADDYGYSDSINEAIDDTVSRRVVNSVSIMANGPAFARAPIDPNHCLSLGAHLNVSEFAPLRPSAALAPLLNREGLFFRGISRTEHVPAALRRAIYEECCAQIERLRDFGISITHLDSHHHFHVNPSLVGVVRSLQKRYAIRRVRTPWNLWHHSSARTRGLLTYRRVWLRMLQFHSPVYVSDYFADLATVHALHCRLSDGSWVEAMVHPGHTSFARETELLLSGEWQRDRFVLAGRGIPTSTCKAG